MDSKDRIYEAIGYIEAMEKSSLSKDILRRYKKLLSIAFRMIEDYEEKEKFLSSETEIKVLRMLALDDNYKDIVDVMEFVGLNAFNAQDIRFLKTCMFMGFFYLSLPEDVKVNADIDKIADAVFKTDYVKEDKDKFIRTLKEIYFVINRIEDIRISVDKVSLINYIGFLEMKYESVKKMSESALRKSSVFIVTLMSSLLVILLNFYAYFYITNVDFEYKMILTNLCLVVLCLGLFKGTQLIVYGKSKGIITFVLILFVGMLATFGVHEFLI